MLATVDRGLPYVVVHLDDTLDWSGHVFVRAHRAVVLVLLDGGSLSRFVDRRLLAH